MQLHGALTGAIVLYALMTVECTVLLVLFMKRSDKEPIRSRTPTASIVGAVAINMVALFQISRAAGVAIPCGLTDIIYQVIWSIAVASYFFRIVALLHAYEKHMRIARRARREMESSLRKDKKDKLTKYGLASDSSDRLRKRVLVQRQIYNQSPWKAMLCYAAFKSIFLILVIATASANVAGQSWTETSLDCNVWGTYLSFIGDVCIAIFCVFLIRKNRIEDPFLIVSELKLTIYVAIATMGPWSIIWLLTNRHHINNLDGIYGKLYVILSFAILAQTLILGFPLYYTYNKNPDSNSEGDEENNVPRAKLITILISRAHRAKFMKFLLKEWSSENLLFIDAVNKWLRKVEEVVATDLGKMKLSSLENVIEKAKEIYTMYIDPSDAAYQVNLPSKLVFPMIKFFKYNMTPPDDDQKPKTIAKKDKRSSDMDVTVSPESKQERPLTIVTSTVARTNSSKAFGISSTRSSKLSFEKEQMLLAKLEILDASKTMLEKAKKLIFQLVERDSYSRFCTTREGKAIMYEVAQLKIEERNI
mmetsp:Transcript_340/g.525  ORF Transcript_340/g.525 Transcript_340/m.525 type:complete len:533 (+) Transcript_340:270-1868(+)|eukprot:CAMPEP_0197528230 /NCGR_PEP_ID=MMETSP1318-20131121/24371_1 /TAXON_ID=552666 /ORGANISM="Partenskyella glossopodia, Strain RCC365" /LENGTH=532 /DNA_ID=CAMNT_0043083241 /DNA_START=213 /DNA_END=1811 /DNA_ORIENTATION=+